MAGFEDFLNDTETPVVQQETEFDKFLSGAQEEDALKQSMTITESLGLTPDQFAEARALAKKTGIPAAAVEPNIPEVKKVSERLDLLKAAKENPDIARILADPNAMKVAKDDIGTLGAISNALKRSVMKTEQMFYQYESDAANQRAQDAGRSFMEILRNAERTPLAPIYGPDDVATAAIRYLTSRGDKLLGLDSAGYAARMQQSAGQVAKDTSMVPRAEASQRFTADTQAAYEQGGVASMLTAAVSDPLGMMAFIGETGLEQAPQLAAMIVATVATRNPAVGAATMGGASYTTERYLSPAEFFQKRGIDLTDTKQVAELMKNQKLLEEAQQYGITRGAIIGTIDTISGGLAAKSIMNGPLKNMFAQIGVQAGMGAGGEAAAQYATEGEVNPVEVFYEAIGELFTAPIDVVTLNQEYSRLAKTSAAGSMRAARARDDAETLRQMSDAAEQSKVKQRDPDAFRDIIRNMKENGGPSEVYVPAEKFVEYFQSINIDPASLGFVDQAELDSALANGGDIQIPIEAYLTDLDRATQDGLQNYVRFSEDSMTLEEAEAWYASADEVAAQEEKRINEDLARAAQENEPVQSVYQDVRNQLIDAGRSPEVADKEARTAAARYKVRAKLRGVDAFELYRQEGYRTIREMSRPYINQPIDSMDMFIAEARDYVKKKEQAQKLAEDKPRMGNLFGLTNKKREKVTPRPVVRYLMNKGGVDPQGAFAKELAAMDITPATMPRLFKKGGLGSLDTIPASEFNEDFAEFGVRANEDGNGYVDPQFIYDMLREESFGNYARTQAERDAEAREQNFEEFRSILARYDLDVESDPADIKDALRRYRSETELDLYQADGTLNTESEAFKNWFGDSKVVDENGKPLVVYHGTIGNVDQFDQNRLGENTGAESAGMGFFFTDDARTAGSYAEYAATDARVASILREADEAEKRGDWDIYDQKISEAEQLEATFADTNNRQAWQNIVPVYLSIQNPMRFDAKGENAVGFDIAAAVKAAKRAGHDGVIIENLDDAAGLSGQIATHYVAFSAPQIKSIHNRGTWDANDPRILYQDGNSPRGSFTPETRIIRLFETANLSTFIHESGHAWMEEMRADADWAQKKLDAHKQSLADGFPGGRLEENRVAELEKFLSDYDKLLKYVGAEAGQPFTREQHETFARTVEAYFMTGKAPSVELQPVFQRFKAWLTAIYRSIKNLNVNINPEISGVLDRMLATEDEIAQAERAAKMEALVIDGATPDEQARLDRLHRAATAEADSRLLEKAMEPVRRQREKWYREEWRKTADEVQAELEARPEWRALALTRGSEDVDPVKIDLRALEDQFGSGIRSLLPRGVTSTKNGADPEVVAEAAGFADAREMVEALGGIRGKTLKQAVKAETDARMAAKYGDVMNDGTIEAEAQDAVHNEKRGDAIAMELKVLRRLEAEKVARKVAERRVAAEGALDAQTYQSEAAVAETGMERLVAQETGRAARFARSYDRSGRQKLDEAMAVIDPKAIREAARRVIGRMKGKDLGKTAQYSRAEVKAAEESRKAIAARDYEKAVFYKYRQLLNHYLFIEAKKAQEETDTITKYLGRLASKKTIATMDQDYLEQIHGLLEKFDFKRASQKEVERRKSFADWAAEQQAAGRDIVAPKKLVEMSQTQHYSDVPLDDLRALRDTVRQIENLGRMKQKLQDAQDERDYQEAISDIVETIENNKDTVRRSASENKTKADRFFSLMRSADAQLLKMEQVIDWLDGGNPNGPLNRMVYQRLSAAQGKENDLTVKYVADMEKILSGLDAKRMQQRFTIAGKIDEQGRQISYTRADLMAIALNMGNEENLFRLTAKKGNNFTEAQLDEVTKLLNADEAKAVQDIWDLINTLWPEIAELERRVNGVAPPKVEAREFTMETADGPVKMRGGYYPIVYNPEKDARAARYADKAAAALFDENSYVRANTQQGHAKERMEGIAKPLRLDMEIIPRHLSQVIHDIAFREAIIDTNRILSDPRVTKAVNATLGKEYHDQFRPWLKAIANDRNLAVDQEAGAWRGFLRGMRTNATVVAMGFRFTTMFAQIAGLPAGAEMIGAKWMGVGMKEVYGDPSRIGEVMQAIRDESAEMRHRHNQIDRDMRDAQRKMMGQDGLQATAQRWAFAGISIVDRGVVSAVYTGAKLKGLSEGMTDAQAIAYAEKVVRLTQSAGGTKDLSAIQRGEEGQKLITMFYSYFNVMYARMRDIGRTTVQERKYAEAFWRSTWLILAPAIMGELLTGKGPDDDEEWEKWAARKIATYPFAALPLVRDLTNSLESGFDYSLSPAARSGETILKPVKAAAAVLNGKDVDAQKAIMSTIEASGYVFGLPTGQLTKSANYLWDYLDGDQKPDDILEFARGVTIGPKKN